MKKLQIIGALLVFGLALTSIAYALINIFNG